MSMEKERVWERERERDRERSSGKEVEDERLIVTEMSGIRG
jgi:hypothetical protein